MKKMWKSLAVLMSLLAFFGFGLASCSSDDDDETPANNGGGDGLAAGGSYSVLTTERKSVTASESAGTITLKIGTAEATSYSTIQAALTAAQSATDDCVITLGSGTYNENGLTYAGSANLKVSGKGTAEYGLDVLIKGHGSDNSTEKGRTLFEITGSGNVILENLTIQNDEGMTEGTAQREALATDGTGNLAAYNCSFLSGQDTLRTVAKAWFYKCYIEGDVDFLWMEYTGGVAALYENCVIRAIGTRTTKAYFAAPRLGLTSKVGKGLVIYNSTLEAETGLENLYLGRNPWSSSGIAQTDYYEQVAIISSPLYLASGVTLTDAWASPANGTSNQAYIGFKTDDYYAKSAKYGTRIGSAFISKEYAGRENILNRLYSTGSAKFVKDGDTYWNVAKIIEDNGWTVTADSSKSLLDGETEVEAKIYDFSTADAGAYVDSTVTIDGFSRHSSGTASGAATKTITIPVTGKSLITVKGCYSGWGTIKAGNQGEGVYCFETGSTSKWAENTYVVYDETATSVVITAGTTTYIQKVTVENDSSLSYTAVSKVEVSSKASSYTVGVPVTLTATVSPDNATNVWVKWSSSDEEVGTIDEFTGTANFLKAGSVTFTAKARDGSEKSGTITCTPAEASWESAEWYDTGDSSSATSSGGGTSLGGSGGENNSVFDVTGAGGVTLGKVIKVNDVKGAEVSISRGIKMNSSGTVTFSVTKPAKVTVLAAYCSDSNVTTDKVGITASNNGTATAWKSNPTAVPTADATYIWSLTAGTYKLSRAGSGYAPAIYYVRVDIGEFEDTSSTTAVTAISVTDADSGTSSSIATGGVVQLTAAVTPSNATDSAVTWSSSDNTKATVSSSGLVTGVAAGTVTITATAHDGSGVTGTYEVTVTSASVSTVIDKSTIIRFGSSGNYSTVTQLNLSNITVSDNGADNSQIKEGSMTFDVLAGAKVTVNGYSGYTSYKLGDGTTTTDTITDTAYTYTATNNCTITITPQSSNNYFYNIVVAYTLNSNTTISFGTAGNYKDYVDLTKIQVADNGTDNSQVKNGYFTFGVASGATVTVAGYPSYTSYTLGDGTTSNTITDTTYTYNATSDCTITITPGNNNYLYSITITYAASGSGDSTATKATAKTYDFTGKTYDQFTGLTLVANYKVNNVATETAVTADNVAEMIQNASGTLGWSNTDEVTIADAKAKGASSKIRIRFNKVSDAYTATSTSSALNYNGGGADDISSTVTVSSLDRYISIPVDGAGTISASIKFVGSSGKTGTLQAGLYDASGSLVGTLLTAGAGDGKITNTEANTGTLTGTVTAATTVYLVFSRNGAAGGGMDVTSIAVTPAE